MLKFEKEDKIAINYKMQFNFINDILCKLDILTSNSELVFLWKTRKSDNPNFLQKENSSYL